jgi:transcriptional regulator with XRE-family HTH domain|tara:strand:- start:141 stop:878 length:738 start_codon:yes stop_codon:yes gene_type:complete
MGELYMVDSLKNKNTPSVLAKTLTQLMISAGLNQKELAIQAGLNETAVRDIRQGRSQHPRHDTIEKLAKALNCSLMTLLAPDTGEQTKFLKEELSNTSNEKCIKAQANILNSVSLPLFDCSFPIQYPLDAEKSRMSWPFPQILIDEIAGGDYKKLFALIVRGDSMSPTIRNGSLAIIDIKTPYMSRDGVYMIYHKGGLMARRLTFAVLNGVVTITCDNTDFSGPQIVSPKSINIAGRIIWLGQKT